MSRLAYFIVLLPFYGYICIVVLGVSSGTFLGTDIPRLLHYTAVAYWVGVVHVYAKHTKCLKIGENEKREKYYWVIFISFFYLPFYWYRYIWHTRKN